MNGRLLEQSKPHGIHAPALVAYIAAIRNAKPGHKCLIVVYMGSLTRESQPIHRIPL